MVRRVTIGIGAAFVSLALAPGALAGTPLPPDNLGTSGPIEYLRTKFPNVVSQAGPATGCGLEQELTGGGAAISGSAATGHLNSSGPVTSAESWLGEGRSSASGGATVTSWAMCGPGAVSRMSSSENFNENTGQFNFSLGCPAGELPLSPGITSSAGDIELFGMFPAAPPNAWTLSIGNPSPSPGEAKLWSLCSGSYPVRFSEESRKVDKGKTGKVIAKCRKREAVMAGGFKVVRGSAWQQDVPALAARPWDSKDDDGKTPDDGYYLKSFNGTNRTVTMTSYAVCTPPL